MQAVLKQLIEEPCLLFCGSLFQTAGPWYSVGQITFVLTGGIFKQSWQEGTEILRMLSSYWGPEPVALTALLSIGGRECMVYLHKANDVRLLWVTFQAYMHQKVGESAGQSCVDSVWGCCSVAQCHGSLFWDMSLSLSVDGRECRANTGQTLSLSVDGGRVQG